MNIERTYIAVLRKKMLSIFGFSYTLYTWDQLKYRYSVLIKLNSQDTSSVMLGKGTKLIIIHEQTLDEWKKNCILFPAYDPFSYPMYYDQQQHYDETGVPFNMLQMYPTTIWPEHQDMIPEEPVIKQPATIIESEIETRDSDIILAVSSPWKISSPPWREDVCWRGRKSRPETWKRIK